MIRLRCALAQTLERRWIGPLVLILLVALLAFVGLHVFADHFEEAAAATCGGILIVAVIPFALSHRQETGDAVQIAGIGTLRASLLPPPPEGIAQSLPQTPLRR